MAPSTVVSSRIIHAPVSKALAVLHDPPKLARLNPLLVTIEQSPTDPSLYTMTDRLSVLGFIPMSIQVTARFTFTDDGVDAHAESSAGFNTVKLRNEWRAKAQGENTCEVTETVFLLQTNALLKPFVISTMKKARKEILDTLAKQLEGRDDTTTSRLNVNNSYFGALSTTALIGVCMVLACFALYDVSNSLRKYCTTFVAIALAFLWLAFSRLRTNDPYGSFHIAFNIPPGHDSSTRPTSEWLNMGYWKYFLKLVKVFSELFVSFSPLSRKRRLALALKLIETARCLLGGHVLDVGHACGDSLLLHLRHQNVPRPRSLTGITSLSSQHARALERITQQQSTEAQETKVAIFCGDAIFRPGLQDHPLNPQSATPKFTTILALDCAYHFATRELFLRQCFTRLLPGGRIALADLAVSEPLTFSLRMVLSRLLGVHSDNMITPRMYEAQLETVGYVDIRIEDISDDVFPGFRLFLKSRGGIWRIFELVIGWWVKAGGMFVIVSASKSEAPPA